MKTLIRSLAVAVVLVIAGGAAPAAAQRVSVDIHLGTPGFSYRQYNHGHRVYRRYNHRPYAWRYGPRVYGYRRPVVIVRPVRPHYRRHYDWH